MKMLVKPYASQFANQSGMTLLEILVTIVIISFGLLGVAGLQLAGIKNNDSAFRRTTATVLANDIIDRMRVNRKQMMSGSYDTGGNFYDSTTSIATTDMAGKDMQDWVTSLTKRLPSAKGKIEAASAATTIKVTIQWNDQRATGGSNAQTLSVEAQGCGTDTTCNF
jgi:type IV pilus assembly protein PilV